MGNPEHPWAGLTPLRVRGLHRVALVADLVMLARLASALARARAVRLAVESLLARRKDAMGLPAVRADEFRAAPSVGFTPKLPGSALPVALLTLERLISVKNVPDERLGIDHAAQFR